MKGDRDPSDDVAIIVKFCDSIESAMEHFGKDEEDFLESELYQNSCCFALLQSEKRLRDCRKISLECALRSSGLILPDCAIS